MQESLQTTMKMMQYWHAISRFAWHRHRRLGFMLEVIPQVYHEVILHILREAAATSGTSDRDLRPVVDRSETAWLRLTG